MVVRVRAQCLCSEGGAGDLGFDLGEVVLDGFIVAGEPGFDGLEFLGPESAKAAAKHKVVYGELDAVLAEVGEDGPAGEVHYWEEAVGLRIEAATAAEHGVALEAVEAGQAVGKPFAAGALGDFDFDVLQG